MHCALCETDADECSRNPCRAGQCIDAVQLYRCQCPVNMAGRVCERRTYRPTRVITIVTYHSRLVVDQKCWGGRIVGLLQVAIFFAT